jgi:hypothetical protein
MISPNQFVTVTTVVTGPQGVVNVTVNIPRVMLFDVIVNVAVWPGVTVVFAGDIVRLPTAEEVISPPWPPSSIVTLREPPFFLIENDGIEMVGTHPAGPGLGDGDGLGEGYGVGVGVGVGVECGPPFPFPFGVAVGDGVGLSSTTGGVGF